MRRKPTPWPTTLKPYRCTREGLEFVSTRVFLVDDHEIVRRGLADTLRLTHGLVVVGESGTVGNALVRIPELSPDVAILDVRLQDGSGIDLCRELRPLAPKTRFLMLSSFIDDDLVKRAARAGASGYLLKELRGPEIVLAVQRIARGEQVFDAGQVEVIQQSSPAGNSAAERYATLSPKEREVLTGVGAGLTNRQIGEELNLAEKTIKNYLSSVMAKLGVHRRTQAAIMVLRGDFDTADRPAQHRAPPTDDRL